MNINENNKEARSQTDRILEYMLEGHAITPLEALNRFGCSRLAARVADIKAKGYLVYAEFVTTVSGKRIKRYYL